MFCPSCGVETNDQTKFCTKCGTNLVPVKDALTKTESGTGGSNPWTDPWLEYHKELASMATKALKNRGKKTPEEKRLEEIKGGVITSSVGLGLIFFLSLLFGAIAGTVAGPEKDILLALRFVGIIPFMVGIGIF